MINLSNSFEKLKIREELLQIFRSNDSLFCNSMYQELMIGNTNKVLTTILEQHQVAPVETELVIGLSLIERINKVMVEYSS